MAWAELILHTDYVFSLFWFVLVGTNFYWNPKFESGAGPMFEEPESGSPDISLGLCFDLSRRNGIMSRDVRRRNISHVPAT